jgi:hypothetical protein
VEHSVIIWNVHCVEADSWRQPFCDEIEYSMFRLQKLMEKLKHNVDLAEAKCHATPDTIKHI